MQLYVVTSRECVPVSSQVEEYPAQALQSPCAVVSQVVPSVSRAQACDSPVSVPVHDASAQAKSVRVRRCIPVSSQVPSNPPHPDHSVYVVSAPQASP